MNNRIGNIDWSSIVELKEYRMRRNHIKAYVRFAHDRNVWLLTMIMRLESFAR
jgi:hypothetical protein